METQIEKIDPIVLYYYVIDGVKLYTSNLLLATARAESVGGKVHEELV